MLDSIYHMTFKLIIKNHIFGNENVKILSSFMQRYNGHLYVTLQNLLTTSGLSISLYGVITLPEAMSCDKSIKMSMIIIGLLNLRFKTSSPTGNDRSTWSQHNVWGHHDL